MGQARQLQCGHRQLSLLLPSNKINRDNTVGQSCGLEVAKPSFIHLATYVLCCCRQQDLILRYCVLLWLSIVSFSTPWTFASSYCITNAKATSGFTAHISVCEWDVTAEWHVAAVAVHAA